MLHDATANLNYSYDQENRITGAAGYTYTYDGDGNRVEKSNGSTGTLYWYMSPGIVAESDLSGNLTSEYVFFDGERVARHDNPSSAGPVFYYFSDHLKTTDIVTDAQGNIKNESDFYPWGGELQFVANDSNNHYKFTGKERDAETGLDYFGARYYSNGLGRFITPDWAAKATAVPYAEFSDPQSLTLYTYVRNIPTSRFDVDGHQCGEMPCNLSPTGGPDMLKGLANTPSNLLNGTTPMLILHALGVPAIPKPFPNGNLVVQTTEILAPLLLPGLKGAGAGSTKLSKAEPLVQEGSFSIIDWTGYPKSLPKPSGPFRLLHGDEYDAARTAANATNRSLHAADSSLDGMQIHEIQPVKFNGSPTNLANKIPMASPAHSQATTWWNQLQRSIEGELHH